MHVHRDDRAATEELFFLASYVLTGYRRGKHQARQHCEEASSNQSANVPLGPNLAGGLSASMGTLHGHSRRIGASLVLDRSCVKHNIALSRDSWRIRSKDAENSSGRTFELRSKTSAFVGVFKKPGVESPLVTPITSNPHTCCVYPILLATLEYSTQSLRRPKAANSNSNRLPKGT